MITQIIIAIYTLLSVYCMWRMEMTNLNFRKSLKKEDMDFEGMPFIIYFIGFLLGGIWLIGVTLIYGISVLHWNRNIFNGEKLK